METEPSNEVYQEILNTINEIIPVEWKNVLLYAEILNDSREVYFFFNTNKQQEYIYSHDIPDIFEVDENIYDDLLINLQNSFKKMRDEFKINDQKTWTNLTLRLKNRNQFAIVFNYDDISNSHYNTYQRMVIWEYENLGILPKNEEDRKIVLEFTKNKKSNN
ncbi:antitoxin YezG family protein [Bacillus safensis]|uniref:antitoxin YezG family protein n=1 Tax=Bacillus safensis TaxID=561879 RepID=UPI00203BDCD4|nr:antitoxin YezG family protein [Bacillus safensis]MCM2988255.1 antitoxin YezG family protein [Bacillus safensis]